MFNDGLPAHELAECGCAPEVRNYLIVEVIGDSRDGRHAGVEFFALHSVAQYCVCQENRRFGVFADRKSEASEYQLQIISEQVPHEAFGYLNVDYDVRKDLDACLLLADGKRAHVDEGRS